jgi:hypothetical protein
VTAALRIRARWRVMHTGHGAELAAFPLRNGIETKE